jgi:CRISPR-associated protein Csm2
MAFNKNVNPQWVHEPVTQEVINWCEEFGKYLTEDVKREDGKGIEIKAMTTTQLRKFFGEVKRIEMNGFDLSEFIMLNPLLAYAAGREKEKTKLKDFQEQMSTVIREVKDEKDFKNFVNIFEAIVAYHKCYGGK